MRNRWNVEIRAGLQCKQGRIVRTDTRSNFARAYGAQVTVAGPYGAESTINAQEIARTWNEKGRTYRVIVEGVSIRGLTRVQLLDGFEFGKHRIAVEWALAMLDADKHGIGFGSNHDNGVSVQIDVTDKAD